MKRRSRTLEFLLSFLLFVVTSSALWVVLGIVGQQFVSDMTAMAMGFPLALALTSTLWFWRSNGGWIVSAVAFLIVFLLLSTAMTTPLQEQQIQNVGMYRLLVGVAFALTGLIWSLRYRLKPIAGKKGITAPSMVANGEAE
jgi:hypothetical protein